MVRLKEQVLGTRTRKVIQLLTIFSFLLSGHGHQEDDHLVLGFLLVFMGFQVLENLQMYLMVCILSQVYIWKLTNGA